MDDFLAQFNLFGITLIVLIPFVVQGLKKLYAMRNGVEISGTGQVVLVIAVSEVLVGFTALVHWFPESEDIVRYVLAGILVPLSSAGGYSMFKAVTKGNAERDTRP